MYVLILTKNNNIIAIKAINIREIVIILAILNVSFLFNIIYRLERDET